MELWTKYAPILLFDKREPFDIKRIGCTVFTTAAPSPSFPGSPSRRRVIDPAAKGAAFAIEYAYSYDYDIQHLYELEHVWVYVAQDESVCGCEASFHGKYLNQMVPRFPILPIEDPKATHVCLFVQPGKHAFLPHPDLFALYPEADSCCTQGAGRAGLDTPEMFQAVVPSLTEQQQQMVRDYIKKNYAFEPSWQFEPKELSDSLYTTWSVVAEEVPKRIDAELHKMRVQL